MERLLWYLLIILLLIILLLIILLLIIPCSSSSALADTGALRDSASTDYYGNASWQGFPPCKAPLVRSCPHLLAAPLSLRLPCLAWTRLDRRNDGRYPCRSCRLCRSSVSSRTPSTFGSAPTSSVPTTTSAGPASSISLVSASPSPHCRALAPVPQPCGCACLEAGQGAAVDLARDGMPSGACFGIGCTTKASLKGSAENPDKSVPAPFHPAVPPCSPPFPIEASKGGRPEPYAGRIIRHTTSNTSDAPAPGLQASD